MDFVAIDFETANEHRASACEVSLIRFKDGQVVEKYSSLIRPHSSMGFNSWNVRIHGISEEQVLNAPELSAIYRDIIDFTNGLPLVAHNASFDMSVLKRSADLYEIRLPELEFYCTVVLAKQSGGLSLPSYSLANVCHALGIEFQEIHRAENDAIACARVVNELALAEQVPDLSSLALELGVRPGMLSSISSQGTGRVSRTSYPSALGKGAANAFLDSLSEGDFSYDDDFLGREVIFTGSLSSMTREAAQQMVLKAGGKTGNGITKRTSIVVVGTPYDSELKPGAALSGKLQKVMTLRESGAEIQLLDEIEFLELFEN